MSISWFPGHMLTARKEAILALRRTDVVIEVLDARVPRASCNPEFEVLRRENQRPALKLLNKEDLADRGRTQAWLAYYNALPATRAIAISAKRRGDVQRILVESRLLAPTRATAAKPLRMMILGIPNVGKSTIMNTLLNRRVAKVGDEPAITKVHMLKQVGPHMTLIDTPGMMWAGVAQDVAFKLAATHSIGRNAYDDGSVALELAHYLAKHYRDRIIERFGELPAGADGHVVIASIATSRGFRRKGGESDLDKASTILLQDFRTGRLGPITLETPETLGEQGQEPR